MISTKKLILLQIALIYLKALLDNSQNLHLDYYRFAEIILITPAITQHRKKKHYLRRFVNS